MGAVPATRMMEKDMKVERTYIANDGKRFDNENECCEYEEKLREKARNELLQEIKDLDLAIWKKYHPDYKEESEPELYQASMWLNADVAEIMIEFPESENDIISIVKASKHGEKILSDYLHMDSVKTEVDVKTDFLSALRSVKDGSDLSSDIGWRLSDRDLSELAKLHKANKCRRKIEELLTNCNFHYECGKFANKEYDEFLK